MKTKSRYAAVLGDSRFLRLWCATVLSALGDAIFFIVLVWFVVDVTGSESKLGTTLLCSSLPRLLLMLVGGVAADRIDRKIIMTVSVAARFVVLCLFGLFISHGHTAHADMAIYLMAVLFGCVDAFFWPARSSIVPLIVAKENLAVANSLMDSSLQLSQVIGPALAALFLLLPNYPTIFLAIASTFLLSGLLLLTVKMQLTTQSETSESTAPAKTSAWAEIREGVSYVLTIRVITLIMVIALFINMFFMGPLNIGMPLLAKHLGWNGSQYGSLESVLGVGAILGGVLTGLLNGFRGSMRWLPLALVVNGLTFASMAGMNRYGVGLTIMAVTGITLTVINIPINTYVQTIVDADKLGRVMSLLTFMSMGLMPVAYALSSFLMSQHIVSAQMLFFIGGIGIAVLGFSLLFSKDIHRIEQHPLWVASDGKKRNDQEHKEQTLPPAEESMAWENG